MQEETISIITDESPTIDTRSWEAPPEVDAKYKVEISVDKLEQEMGRFLHIVSRLFQRAEVEAERKSGMRLDEIELSVEINGEGKISLIGSGAKAGGKGAITLKFKRQELG
jgi:ArsR family metal-binding transcriptional regulator